MFSDDFGHVVSISSRDIEEGDSRYTVPGTRVDERRLWPSGEGGHLLPRSDTSQGWKRARHAEEWTTLTGVSTRHGAASQTGFPDIQRNSLSK